MCERVRARNFHADPRPRGCAAAWRDRCSRPPSSVDQEEWVMKSARQSSGQRFGRAVLGIVAAAVLSATWGCAHVAPYERGTLAHPTMSAEDPYTTPLANHVQDVSEGATGGLSGGGGGCGCN
jgi:hypothetical protein